MREQKAIFLATHPRACSTAFERVFMTCRDTLTCIHEPFGDAYYYGPERLGERFAEDEKARNESGFSSSTYMTIFNRFEKESDEGKRLFIKDMALYLVPPNSQPASIAPSLTRIERGVGTLTNKNSTQTNGDTNSKIPNGISKSSSEARVKNPTVVPLEMLQKFQFTFLIRHPRSSIPSYYRCCIPPLNGKTGFTHFMPSEAGYDEMRKMFDYLRAVGEIGPVVAGQNGKEVNGSSQAPTTSGHTGNESSSKNVDICVVDADDLLDNPAGIIEAYCQAIGYEYDPAMLNWDSKKDHGQAEEAFAKWNGFHEDAIHSSELKPRQHRKAVKTEDEENEEWAEKYGADAAKIIRETVDTNVKDYEYLKQFALKV